MVNVLAHMSGTNLSRRPPREAVRVPANRTGLSKRLPQKAVRTQASGTGLAGEAVSGLPSSKRPPPTKTANPYGANQGQGEVHL